MQQFLIAHLGDYNSKFSKFTFFSLIPNIFSMFSSPPYTYIELQYFNLGKGTF